MSALGESVQSDWSAGRWHLSLRQKLILAGEVVSAYVRTRAALRRHDALPEVLAALRACREVKRHEGRSPLEAGIGLANAVARTLGVLPADSRCLMRSLVLISLLSRRGIAADLVIGVRTDRGEFRAHAWVEHESRALLPSDESYARLTEL